MDLDKVEISDPGQLAVFQRLFDASRYEPMGDQLGIPLPPLQVRRVWQVHHEQTRAEYLLSRQQLVDDLVEGPPYQRFQVPSQQVSLAGIHGHETVNADYNEFYLFHGTSFEAAEAITDGDFFINEEGKNGRTFGQGVYAAEFVNHAQLFAILGNEVMEGNRIMILVCRCFCGRIQDGGTWHATGTPSPGSAGLEARIESGDAMATVGSEWPQTGYRVRDFIIPDDDQILPEFMVECSY